MDWDLIERLIGLVERSRVTDLECTVAGTRVRIERHAGAGAASVSVTAGRVEPAKSPAETPPARPAPEPPAAHTVAAGLFGTFYRSPAPGQPPFVSEGDAVEEGQTLAILEAMKMLNPVEADRAGRISRILVEDGVAVEAGTPLFILAAAE